MGFLHSLGQKATSFVNRIGSKANNVIQSVGTKVQKAANWVADKADSVSNVAGVIGAAIGEPELGLLVKGVGAAARTVGNVTNTIKNTSQGYADRYLKSPGG